MSGVWMKRVKGKHNSRDQVWASSAGVRGCIEQRGGDDLKKDVNVGFVVLDSLQVHIASNKILSLLSAGCT